MSLSLAALPEIKESHEAENWAQGLGCSLPLYGCFQEGWQETAWRQAVYLMSLGLEDLQKSSQSFGAGNAAEGMRYSLLLLGVLSDELTGRDLEGRRAYLLSLVPTEV